MQCPEHQKKVETIVQFPLHTCPSRGCTLALPYISRLRWGAPPAIRCKVGIRQQTSFVSRRWSRNHRFPSCHLWKSAVSRL